jgi:signal transduction histidine kinase
VTSSEKAPDDLFAGDGEVRARGRATTPLVPVARPLGIAGPVTEGQKAQLERVRASSQHLLGLIENVLDLAKVEAGRMDVEYEHVLAVNTIAAALALVGPQAAKRGIQIDEPCADDTSTVYVGDQDRVRQILANLLSNAAKFTPTGGDIRVTCGTSQVPRMDVETSEEGPLTYIRVRDTGIGIAPEEMETIFRPFTQVERATPVRVAARGWA